VNETKGSPAWSDIMALLLGVTGCGALLKVAGVVDVSWITLLAPVWGAMVGLVVSGFFIFFVALLLWARQEWKKQ